MNSIKYLIVLFCVVCIVPKMFGMKRIKKTSLQELKKTQKKELPKKFPYLRKIKKRKHTKNLLRIIKENKKPEERTYTRVFPPITNKKDN